MGTPLTMSYYLIFRLSSCYLESLGARILFTQAACLLFLPALHLTLFFSVDGDGLLVRLMGRHAEPACWVRDMGAQLIWVACKKTQAKPE